MSSRKKEVAFGLMEMLQCMCVFTMDQSKRERERERERYHDQLKRKKRKGPCRSLHAISLKLSMLVMG